MNSLAIFDIDGTLTDTNAVDDACFRSAVGEELGVPADTLDWADALHFTDRALFDFLCEAHGRPLPSPSDVSRVRGRLTEFLTSAANTAPEQFLPIPGAPRVFSHLAAEGWRVSVATGCWRPSARVKLRAATIDVDDALIACADDFASRTDIVTLSRARAESFYGCEFGRVVSIGDGLWDVETAEALGLPLVGIGHGDRADRLRRAGASVVIENYADLGAFTNALAAARVPGNG